MNILFKKRRSVRAYRPDPIEKEKIEEILAAAHSAPSAGNLKARKIIVVEEEGQKRKLAEASFGQSFVAEAPLVLVFAALPEISAEKYGQRGKNLYALQDATIAASFAWLQAVDLELSACWVGAFDENEVREILNLSEKEMPIAVLPIGYAKN
jgi:nitroreductase